MALNSKVQAQHFVFIGVLLYILWRAGINWFLMDDPFARLDGDGVDFVKLATSIHERGEYNMGPGEPPYSLRNPGFSVYLAALMKLLGEKWLEYFFLFQVFALVIAVGLVFVIVHEMRDRLAAAIAALLVASYAPYHYLSTLVYREATCLPLFALFLLLLLPKFYHRFTFAAFGALLGVMTLLREEFLLLTFPCVVFLWVQECWESPKKWQPFAKRVVGVAAVMLLVMSPWIIRNAKVFGKLQFTGTLGGVQLYMGNRPNFDANVDYSYYKQVPEYDTHSPHEVNSMYLKRAIEFVVTHPVQTLKHMGIKWRMVWSSNMRGKDDFVAVLLGLLIGGLLGIAKGGPRGLSLGVCAGVAVAYVGYKGIHLSLLLPNIQFHVAKFVGIAGMIYLACRRETPYHLLTWLVLFSVNLIFVPQHRHRWIIDMLFLIWAAIFVRDMLMIVQQKWRGTGDQDHENAQAHEDAEPDNQPVGAQQG